jgi:hypothetical protein
VEHATVFDSGALSLGTHTIRCTVKGTKNASSTDFWCYLDTAKPTQNLAEMFR